MCGQFGIMQPKRNGYADDFIKDAFTASMLRGVDSSGIASIDMRHSTSIIHKLPVMGAFFAEDSFARSLIADAGVPDGLTMCHVRAATVGRVSLSNAHPFEIYRDGKTVIGTHNGTLTNWAGKKGARPFNVDSEWAMSHIHAEGYDAFTDFSGAYSFVWWDSDHPKVLNMARNTQRPMAVCFMKDGGLAYASEPGMLYWLLERNHMKPEAGSIIELEAGKWYKFEVDNPKDFTTVDLPATAVSNTMMFGNNRYSTNTSTTYATTTVDKVNALLAKVGQNTAPASQPSVYESEARMARDYGWLEQDVEFSPIEYRQEDNSVRGLVDVMGATFEGIVRGDVSTFPSTHTWHCKVLGVQDDSQELVMVVSKPYKTTQAVPMDM